eukprot:jgi/Bigna1/89243/estExt_fgenesh1_pg.C_460021
MEQLEVGRQGEGKRSLEERIKMTKKIFQEQERELTVRLQRVRLRRDEVLSGLYKELEDIDQDFEAWQKRYKGKKEAQLTAAVNLRAEQLFAAASGLNNSKLATVGGGDDDAGELQRKDLGQDLDHQHSASQCSGSTGVSKDSNILRKTALPKYFYKSCAVVGNKFFSILDGKSEFAAGVPFRQSMDPMMPEDGRGEEEGNTTVATQKFSRPEFVFSSAAAAKKEKFPPNAALAFAPRVVFKCVTAGRYKDFGNNCYWFENLVAREVVEWVVHK